MADSMITLVGNLVDDPQLRAVGTGTNLSTFRIACTNRRFDRSQEKWVKGASLFMRVACWRQLAAHVCASLRRGDRVVVVGRVRQRSYETKDGQRRVAYEIEADAVGAELTWRAVDVRRPRPPAADNVDPATGEIGSDPARDGAAGFASEPAPDASLDDLAGLDEDRAGHHFDDELDDRDEPDDDEPDDEPDDDLGGGDLGGGELGGADADVQIDGFGPAPTGPPGASVPFSDGVSRLGTVTE